MQSVYLFNRSDNQILEELLRVCSTGRDTAREQWSLQAELLVEPVGWDALWKLSKDFCKKFDVRFPCVAYVSVTSVDFEELSASADVLSVQHEAVTIPETVVDIPLVELWPTIKQREASINAATTAEFIDLLRFFYENIWMPWDDQDGKTLLPKTIEERMSLWSDMHNGTIPNFVARSIITLRNSAIDAYKKLKDLDSSLCDGILDDDDDSLLPPSYISECAEMNARLDSLMSKWTLYENPLIREQYLAKTKHKWQKTKSKRNVVALWQGGSITEFNEISKFLSKNLTNEHNLTVMASAEDGLSLEPDEVVVCNTAYELPEMPLSQISICSFNGATLKAVDMRSCLLMLSEECRLRDLTLQCAQVNTIIVMMTGTLHIKNCMLADVSKNSQRDFAQGIVAKTGAKIVIEDCTFENFYSGIVVHKGAQVELKQCLLNQCGVGIQMYSGSSVKLDGTVITNCSEQSIRYEVYDGCGKVDESEDLQIMPNCKIGSGNLEKEVLTVNHDVELF
ncbi:SHC SH2 domain-binding protein 1-like A [Papilio xuthus]|uniref:SHC SH2 domain-binding protein 1-like A n=1 Tax=Papilio xuthus TaxID=66420 RepID=A0A194Q1D7_PAPXU|nr:SHC SH2 domain-binding protein 1-like A [Papilio xuthus]